MNYLRIGIAMFFVTVLASCGQTTEQDNTTHSSDTMVIKQNQTDSATHTITTDTSKR